MARKYIVKAALFAVTLVLVCTASWGQLPEVPPVDFSRLSADDFADDELDMPYFLAHLHRVANSVVADGPHRGFLDTVVWRRAQDNRPYNARIMENHLTLAYFYCLDRPWNVYRGHPALRARLEAMLEFWLTMQNEDGRFSEYGPQRWNLAATAFATKFMGMTLTLLHDGPPIDRDLLRRVAEADRRTIMLVLSDNTLAATGRVYSNQYTNVWPGALAYLKLYPDPELELLLRKRVVETMADFQSPAGFFYEKNGPDWSYNLGTHHTNLEAASHFTADDDALMTQWREKDQRFYQWLSYNAVLEPDGAGFYLNRAVESRKSVAYIRRRPDGLYSMSVPPVQHTALAVPFSATREELQQRRREARSRLEENWPAVRNLKEFGPYDVLARDFNRPLPTAGQWQEAVDRLPYRARTRFVHQRMDSRMPTSFTFVRRPGYYAIWNAGAKPVEQTRLGLGLIWHPLLGTVLQSQTGSATSAWGTKAEGSDSVFESQPLDAEFRLAGQQITPVPGARDLSAEGDVELSYQLGSAGSKTVVFSDRAIRVRVRHPGRFTEQVPLLCGSGDSVSNDEESTVIAHGAVRLHISYPQVMSAKLAAPTPHTSPKSLRVLWLAGHDQLTYELRFEDAQ